MKNKIYQVVQSFSIAGQIIIMKGDKVKFLNVETIEPSNRLKDPYNEFYFEVVKSDWCEGLEINLKANEVANYLGYIILP